MASQKADLHDSPVVALPGRLPPRNTTHPKSTFQVDSIAISFLIATPLPRRQSVPLHPQPHPATAPPPTTQNVATSRRSSVKRNTHGAEDPTLVRHGKRPPAAAAARFRRGRTTVPPLHCRNSRSGLTLPVSPSTRCRRFASRRLSRAVAFSRANQALSPR